MFASSAFVWVRVCVFVVTITDGYGIWDMRERTGAQV